jgi:thiamine biosynthesis lipoprotein
MRLLLGLFTLVAAGALAGCADPGTVSTTLRGETMGTTWSVKLVVPPGADENRLAHGIQAQLDRVVAQMSTYEPDSDLVRFNRAAPGTWQTLPAEFFTVLEYALDVAARTAGAYDPTVGPLVDLWGFGPGPKRHEIPSVAAIEAARARVGWQHIRLDAANRRAFQPGGVAVDLSSVAKGFGVDQVARHLDRAGVENYLVEVGGELRARGRRADGRAWQVAIEKPGASAGAVERMDEVERVIDLEDLAIATSGDYRHSFTDAGRTFSHHIDPRSGWPVEHRIASVTTLAADAMHADSTGTAIMVLGEDAGMRYAVEHGLAVLLILHDGDGFAERMSPAFRARIAP